MSYELEQIVLRSFYNEISIAGHLDNSVSDSKIVKTAQSKLKAALKDVEHKCTCARRTWGGPCELCQASDKELYLLRNFFRVLRDAKKRDMAADEVRAFIENTKNEIG